MLNKWNVIRISTSVFVPLLLVILAVSSVTGATTIVVDATVDDVAMNGNCTLREATIAANTDTAVDACPAGSGMDTIEVPAGTYYLTLTDNNEHGSLDGDLDLTQDVIVSGAGAELTVIDGSAIDRSVIHVLPGVEAILSNVGITGGNVAGWAGGINNQGDLTVEESDIYGNEGNDGGGIVNREASTLTVVRSTIRDNVADFGGGISNFDTDSVLTIIDSTISGNRAEFGGAMEIYGTATILNSTISGNVATEEGGGIEMGSAFSTLTIVNSTIAENEAAFGGGGLKIYNGSGSIRNSIVAYNLGDDCDGDLPSAGYNIASDFSCDFNLATDQEGTDPVLGSLADNGGPTWTQALLSGSPATDKIPVAACTDHEGNALTADQRGAPRPFNVACDIGAFEDGALQVDIDVKPGSDPNSINCGRNKTVIPVAILTTDDFDATSVDHTTVTFDGASETDEKDGSARRHEEDVDGDGDTDLVFHFRLGDTGLTCDSAEGRLSGETFDGVLFEGVDYVRMLGVRR